LIDNDYDDQWNLDHARVIDCMHEATRPASNLAMISNEKLVLNEVEQVESGDEGED
jgi:hypothetical protein